VTPPESYYNAVFAGFSFVLGSIVGSFLNVCIYRLPLGLSVNEPRRSFCPHCRGQIPWYFNLPLLSWLWLRGRCAQCGKPISVRYPLVELLTAILFLLVWRQFHEVWILVPAYWTFIALVIVATFIDFDHFIIPDEITLSSVGAGVLLSFAIPQLMNEGTHVRGVAASILGAGVGYLTLRAVVEAGKLAFGRKRVVLPEPQTFTWRPTGEGDAQLTIGEEVDLWSEFFSREKDELVLACDRLLLAGQERGEAVLHCFYDRVELDGRAYRLDGMEAFSGTLREFVFPREAMGLGDVKFIAGIGAFLGWRSVFFTVAAASLIGSVFGIGLLLFGPKARSVRVPFGPYLSLGALLWLFVGPRIVDWYLALMHLS
jgi:leader peptidase (prepilin peptidase)/N-methyltransferase